MHFYKIISNSKFLARLSDWMGPWPDWGEWPDCPPPLDPPLAAAAVSAAIIHTSNDLLNHNWTVELPATWHRESKTFLVVWSLTDLDCLEADVLSHDYNYLHVHISCMKRSLGGGGGIAQEVELSTTTQEDPDKYLPHLSLSHIIIIKRKNLRCINLCLFIPLQLHLFPSSWRVSNVS